MTSMQSQHRLLAPALLATTLLAAAIVFSGCDGSSAAPNGHKPDNNPAIQPKVQQNGTEQPKTDGGKKVDMVDQGGDRIGTEFYPGLPLGLLGDKDRKMLRRVTQAQLCPCPGSAESMDSCLQKKEKQCDLAVQAAFEGMRHISEGKNEKDVLDGIGQFIESAYKQYKFNLDGVPHVGPVGAPVVIIEFADYECPFCNHARVIFKEVTKKYGDKVVVYFKNFPLSMHKNSTLAAVASLAAHKQGKFWPMYDLLFDNQSILSPEKIVELARELGLNMQKFQVDIADKALFERVDAERKEAMDAGANSTPSFYVNGRKYLGEKTPEAMMAAVEAELKKK